MENFKESREATKITLNRVESWEDLNAATMAEADEKFKQVTKDTWKEFAVSGTLQFDPKEGKQVLRPFTDLDGRSAIAILKKAGIDISNLTYVRPGEFLQGAINLDTGDKFGVVYEEPTYTAYFDHHAKGTNEVTSTTEIIYRTMVDLGMIAASPALDRLVKFVNDIDNRKLPPGEFLNSGKTIIGVQRDLDFEKMLAYFSEHESPTDILTPEELERYGLRESAERQQKTVDESMSKLAEMERQGKVIDTKYGKVVVNENNELRTGSSAAYVKYDGIINYTPGKSFAITLKDKDFDERDLREQLGHRFQGKIIRGKMWIYNDVAPLQLELFELLEVLSEAKSQHKYRKVPSEGVEWMKRRYQEKGYDKNSEKWGFSSPQDIFGFKLLNYWQFVNKKGRMWKHWEKLGTADRQMEETRELLEKEFEKVQSELINLAKRDPQLFSNFLKPVLSSSSLNRLIQNEEHLVLDIFVKDKKSLAERKNELLTKRVISNYRQDKAVITQEDLILLLQHHRKEVLARERTLKDWLEVYLPELAELLLQAARNKTIPLREEVIIERLSALDITVVDTVSAVLAEKWGDFLPMTHHMRISAYIPTDKRFTTLAHEAFHALSGQMDIEWTPVLSGENEQTMETLSSNFTAKNGLGLQNPTTSIGGTPRLSWLDEALTEKALINLDEQPVSYKKERELLTILINSGITKDLLYAAYFENYGSNPGEHRLPLTKQLFDVTNQKFGVGFLMKLDDYIKQHGVKKALELWKEMGDGFANYVHNESMTKLAEMEKEGKVVDTGYGKLLVNVDNELRTGSSAAYVKYDGIINYTPGKSFAITLKDKDFDERDLREQLGHRFQGKIIRGKMWIYNDKEPLKLSLVEIIKALK